VAGVVLYLSSELSGNVTGTHIVVDGGRSGSGGAPAMRR
jgi:enoyl-[acyl-carrier-protein] reductase (NADH)